MDFCKVVKVLRFCIGIRYNPTSTTAAFDELVSLRKDKDFRLKIDKLGQGGLCWH